MAKVTTVELAARLVLFEDQTKIYNQPFSMNAATYTEHSVDRLVLATNSGWQEVNLGGVDTGVFLQARVSRPVLMSLDATTNPWNIGKGTLGGVIALAGEFTHVYFNNARLTNTAIVNIAVADKND